MTVVNNVGIIGLGNISDRHRKNVKILYPHAKIYSVSASGRNINVSKITGCDELVDSIGDLVKIKPDFTIVASPSSFHFEHVVHLIREDLSVLIEKPVVTVGNEVEQLLHLSVNSSAHVAVAYCLRFLSSAQFVRQIISGNSLGRLYNVFIEVGQFLPDWRPSKDYRQTVSANAHLGGGALLELSHELDYARWIFGEMKLQYADLRSSDELNLNVEDIADLVFSQRDGTLIQIHLDFLQKAAKRSCTVLAENGRLEWDLIGNSVYLYNKNGAQTLFDGNDWDRNQMYLNMLQSFVMKDFRYLASVEEAGQIVKMVDGAKSYINGD